jgi:Flp pilus assembly protein TadG
MTSGRQSGIASPRQQRRLGTGLVEFALVAPLLLVLLAGVLDYGRAIGKSAALANAARVGAQYGCASSARAADSAGIQAAAVNSAPDFTGISVASARSCQCPGGGTVSCSGNCGAGKMLMYVQVTVTAASSAVFSYPALPFTGNVGAQATMRVQ